MVDSVKFIKYNAEKCKIEINKLLSGKNISEAKIQNLKKTIEDIEKDILEKEKNISETLMENTKGVNLPKINNESLSIQKISLDKSNKKTRNKELLFPKNHEKSILKNQITTRKTNTYLNNPRPTYFKDNKKHIDLLIKHKIPLQQTIKKIERDVGNKLMDKEKFNKYSISKRFKSIKINYDEKNNPIILKKDLDRGLMNLINAGLLPKNADLSFAFDQDCKPLKTFPNKDSFYEGVETSSTYETSRRVVTGENKNSVFITHNDSEVCVLPKISDSSLKTEKRSRKSKKQTIKKPGFYEIFNNVLLFSNYNIVPNETFKLFKERNEDRWGNITYLLNIMSRVLKKRNFNFAEVDANKIERLSNDDILNIKLDEILLCLTERDLTNKGLLKNGKFKANNQEDAIITIQKFFRMYFIRKKYHEEIFQHNKILHIQKFYRNIKLKIISSKLVHQKYNFSYFKWCSLMEEFKRNWTYIKQNPRIEIHINSKSFNSHTQSDTSFPRVDNFQLERMIRLIDPNVSMIIICPFKIDEDIIEMYFSFLTKYNVKNARERVTFIIPETSKYLSKKISLSRILYLSIRDLNKIKEIITDKTAYIITGTPDYIDIKLSVFLQCPCLISQNDNFKTLLNKSGCKRIFEISDVDNPIGAWDVKTFEGIVENLVFLIKHYPFVKTWVFKINKETNGRGIAYLHLDRAKELIDFKKEMANHQNLDDSKFESKLKYLLTKFIPIKIEILYPEIFPNWNEYIKRYCSEGGIIEASPTSNLITVGKPTFSFLIEPDGNIEYICSYDRINHNIFTNIAAISPQTTIKKIDHLDLVGRIGSNLYKNGIIGYCSAEFLTFTDKNDKEILWGLDINYGYCNYISSVLFCDFIRNRTFSSSPYEYSNHSSNHLSNKNSEETIGYYAIAPLLYEPVFKSLNYDQLFKLMEDENILYDNDIKYGSILNNFEVLNKGFIAACCIGNSYLEATNCLNILFDLLLKLQINKNTYNDGPYLKLADIIRSYKIYLIKASE